MTWEESWRYLSKKLRVVTYACKSFAFPPFFIFFSRFLFFIFLKSLFDDLIHLTFVILTWKKELNYIILPDYFFRNLFGWNRENGYDTVYSSSLKKDADQNLIIYLSPVIFWCFLFSVTKSILMSSWSHNLKIVVNL